MKLNLASGTNIRDGWMNLDVVPRWPLASRGCDQLWDARTQAIPFPDGSAEEVYAGYLFLHLAPMHHARVLEDIRRVMKLGGRLIVGEVEMDAVMRRWLGSPEDKRLAELIWGEQGDLDQPLAEQAALAEFDKHCHGFTEASLRAFLARGHFREARRIRVHDAAVWYELSLETFKEP